ncbi:prolyl oligopeptidase family serine peptidase [Xanthomonas sp. XNM01]|uniref:carboxylesterase family protein n=1 Tax=Xanthomonas sp. XNM01 TaxID=2769289 RepID=UPI001CE14234|nr:prolyl oligopeptidase family serine peptidase [Xanthomonas sp. XNM01]
MALPRSWPLPRGLHVMALLACLLGAGMMKAHAADAAPGDGFVHRELVHAGQRHRYQVFVPQRHGEGPLPIVLFLHGSGERGDDGDLQTRSGLGPWLRRHAADFPAIVVFPQSPQGASWEGQTAGLALATLAAASAEFGGDRSRTYLTGMSRGGYGAIELALRHPRRFAAVVPICGGVTPPGTRPDLDTLLVAAASLHGNDPFAEAAASLAGIPVWLFHGEDDPVVPVAQSRRLYAALRERGADVRYTELPGTGHNAWDPAYADPALWDWLFARHLP